VNWAIGGLLSVALSVEAKCFAQALPGSVPYGARTFLECLHTRDHPADSILRKLIRTGDDGGVTRPK